MPRPKSSGKARKSPEEDEGVLELHASADDIIDAPPTEEDGAAGGNRASPPDAPPASHSRMENDDSGIGPPERKRIRHQLPREFEPERWVYKRSKVTPANAKIFKQAEVDQLEMTTFGTLRKGEQYAKVPVTKRAGLNPNAGDDWEGAAARRGQRTIHVADVTRSTLRKAGRVVRGLPTRTRTQPNTRKKKSDAAGGSAAAANPPPPEKRQRKSGGGAAATATAEEPAPARKRRSRDEPQGAGLPQVPPHPPTSQGRRQPPPPPPPSRPLPPPAPP